MAVSDISALDPIIRRVGRSGPNRRGEYYISIKAGTDEINPSRWSLVGGQRYIYQVFTEDAGRPWAHGESDTIHLADPQSGEIVNLVITFQAFCPNGNEVKLVQSLGQTGNPSDEFRHLITVWARNYIFQFGSNLFSDFKKAQGDLLNFIAENVATSTGLAFRAQLRLNLANALSLYSIEEFVEVRFNDSTTPQKIFVQCDLDFLPEKPLLAIIAYRRLADLHADLITETKNFFRNNVPAQAFARGLRDQDIADGLRQRFENIVTMEGRQVTGLTITPHGLDRLPEVVHQKLLHAEVRTLGRDLPIGLTSKILLNLDDLAQFQRSQITDLSKWLHQTFAAVVQDVCFEKKYIDYLEKASWGTIEAKIKAEMETKAKEIGYHVKQIFSQPELKENEYKDSQIRHFLVERLPLKSTTPVSFDLKVSATFAILGWEDDDLADKINRGIDLHADITAELHHALAAVLVKCLPNDFVLKFSEPRPSLPSIEDELKSAVRSTLEKKYKAEISFVAVDQVATDEIKTVWGLLDVPTEAEFFATPHGGGEPIKYSLTWKISGVDTNSWSIINRPFCNRENIRIELQKALAGSFSSLRHDQLRFETSEAESNLRSLADRVAKAHVRELFGVTVEVFNLRRDRTKLEQKAYEAHEKLFIARIDEQVDKVSHARDVQKEARKRQLDLVRKTNQLDDIKYKRLTELHEKPTRDRFDDEELAKLQKQIDELAPPDDLTKSAAALLDDTPLEFDPGRLQDQLFHRTAARVQLDDSSVHVDPPSPRTVPSNQDGTAEQALDDLFFQIDTAVTQEAEHELLRYPDLAEWAATSSVEAAGNRLAERFNIDSRGVNDSKFWELFKDELFQFLCTRNPKYAELRKQLKTANRTSKTLVMPALAGAIGATLGLAPGILVPFVALGLLGAAQLGANAWCISKRSKSAPSFTFPNGKPLALRKRREDDGTIEIPRNSQ